MLRYIGEKYTTINQKRYAFSQVKPREWPFVNKKQRKKPENMHQTQIKTSKIISKRK